MLAIAPLHVLFVYGAKRLNGILEFGQSVADEMKARADKLPPDQREAAMVSMIADRKRIERDVYWRKCEEKRFSDAFDKLVRRVCWLFIGIPLLAWFLSTR
jgi:hypothetical protein